MSEQVSPNDLQRLMSQMKVPPCPDAPVVGKVTHYSVDLSWEECLAQANDVINKGDGRIQVTLQEQKAGGAWGKAYSGFAAKYVVESLEPWSQYSYRIKFTNLRGESDWSAPVTITTAKEPFTGDHLHRAIFLDDKSQLERVLQSGDVNVDTPDKHGYSPLMSVAQKGNLDMIDILMSCGADVDYQSDAGKTALMVAALAGQVAAVKELRHHGASYDKKDKGGSSAVHWAVDSANLELVDWMLDDGADVSVKDDNGWTPLMRVAAVGGNKDMANLLLRHHAQTDAKDKDGKTALMMAVVNGHQPLVQLLLDKNADVTIKNEFGKTAYDMALSMERRKIIQSMEEHMQRKGLKIHN